MNSIKALWVESSEEFWQNKNNFYYYFLFVAINQMDILSDLILPKYAENVKIGISLLIFLMSLIASVLFMRTQKKDSKVGDFWYLFIPFLLYSIYYSIVGLLGLIFLFIPGVIFYFAPLIAAFHDKAPPFKTSLKIAKKNWSMAIFLSVTSLLLEVFPLCFKLIPISWIGSLLTSIFGLFEAYIVLILMLMTVKIYYYYITQADVYKLENSI